MNKFQDEEPVLYDLFIRTKDMSEAFASFAYWDKNNPLLNPVADDDESNRARRRLFQQFHQNHQQSTAKQDEPTCQEAVEKGKQIQSLLKSFRAAAAVGAGDQDEITFVPEVSRDKIWRKCERDPGHWERVDHRSCHTGNGIVVENAEHSTANTLVEEAAQLTNAIFGDAFADLPKAGAGGRLKLQGSMDARGREFTNAIRHDFVTKVSDGKFNANTMIDPLPPVCTVLGIIDTANRLHRESVVSKLLSNATYPPRAYVVGAHEDEYTFSSFGHEMTFIDPMGHEVSPFEARECYAVTVDSIEEVPWNLGMLLQTSSASFRNDTSCQTLFPNSSMRTGAGSGALGFVQGPLAHLAWKRKGRRVVGLFDVPRRKASALLLEIATIMELDEDDAFRVSQPFPKSLMSTLECSMTNTHLRVIWETKAD